MIIWAGEQSIFQIGHGHSLRGVWGGTSRRWDCRPFRPSILFAGVRANSKEVAPVEDVFVTDKDAVALPVWPVRSGDVQTWCDAHAGAGAAWVGTAGFTGEAGRVLMLPDESGSLAGALLGLGKADDPFIFAALSENLPEGTYRLAGMEGLDASQAALGWALGTYSYSKYKPRDRDLPKLVLPEDVDLGELTGIADAVFLTRDLVNTPTNDLGPAELETAVRQVADEFGASCSVITGDDLLAQNYPMVHAVGRAAVESAAPRLMDFTWGDEAAPKVTLVGKGVCFDTGGLNLKPGNSMALMKKDMGGAAHVLALAQLIMRANLNMRLRVLIPAVENAVAGNAFRPGDVLPSRKGLSVEIANTDAEGRLILADALAEADGEEPDLLIDMATLTGAARVALGPDLPPFYTHDDVFAAALSEASQQSADPLWRMPLWPAYDGWLSSKIADVNHISDGGFAGSITAALFLARFVEKAKTFVHFDVFAWAPRAKPGRPVGGEAQGIRALFVYLKKTYGHR
ncbi:MAG: leucyl aminopeptidase [Parvibaculum sp.]|nr:leucyl aminopeptidase [Parvibaculum sp.]